MSNNEVKVNTPELYFDGITYEKPHDQKRLGTLQDRVRNLMLLGRWVTLYEIHERCGGSEASCSARLRDLRKPRFGGYNIIRRRLGDPKDGIWEYRLEA